MSQRRRVLIVQLDPAVIGALADRDLAAARQLSGLALREPAVDHDNVATWRLRRNQLAAQPADQGWITGAVVDADTGEVVGRAGFHGRPDARGMVEIGYAIDPDRRRRGYARAALAVLLARARREPGVAVVRASIRPDNLPSRHLVLSCGFCEVGEQEDPEDGRELVYELPLGRAGKPLGGASVNAGPGPAAARCSATGPTG